MRRQRKIVAGVVLFVAVVGLACYFIPKADDLQIQEVQNTQKKLFDLPPGTTREQRRELFGQMRDQLDELSPDQRKELARTAPNAILRHVHQRVSSYFELPDDQRVAFLDKEIRRMEEMFRDMRPPGATGGGPPFGNGTGGEQRDAFQRRFLDNTTPMQRAQITEYFKAIQHRRHELGLATFAGPF
jgi:hypothetical protein